METNGILHIISSFSLSQLSSCVMVIPAGILEFKASGRGKSQWQRFVDGCMMAAMEWCPMQGKGL